MRSHRLLLSLILIMAFSMMFVLQVNADDTDTDVDCESCIISDDSLETVDDPADVQIESDEDRGSDQVFEVEEGKDIAANQQDVVDELDTGLEVLEDIAVENIEEIDAVDNTVDDDTNTRDNGVVLDDNITDEITTINCVDEGQAEDECLECVQGSEIDVEVSVANGDDEGQADEECLECVQDSETDVEVPITNGHDEGQADEQCLECMQCPEYDSVCPQEVEEECWEFEDTYVSYSGQKNDSIESVIDRIWSRSNILRGMFSGWMNCMSINMKQRPVGNMLGSLMCSSSLSNDKYESSDIVEPYDCNVPVDTNTNCVEVDEETEMNCSTCVDVIAEQRQSNECVEESPCETTIASASVSVSIDMSYNLDIGIGKLLVPVWGVPCYVAIETCDAEADGMSCAAVDMASDICA
ncbi:MAG: hypothetical protein SVY53_16010 [Chloroflexota bacterium]|nr:hypothetical protein [Chloroflexota bacterium]